MTIDTQIKTLILFFTFGNYIYFAFYISHYFLKKDLLIYPITTIMTLAFMIILYNFNNGYMHVYFILTMLIGILFSKVCVKRLKFIVFKLKSIMNKWYNTCEDIEYEKR